MYYYMGIERLLLTSINFQDGGDSRTHMDSREWIFTLLSGMATHQVHPLSLSWPLYHLFYTVYNYSVSVFPLN